MLSRSQCRDGRLVKVNEDCIAAVVKSCTPTNTRETLRIGAGGHTIPDDICSKLMSTVGVIVSAGTGRDAALVAWDDWSSGIWIRAEYLDPVKKPRKKKESS